MDLNHIETGEDVPNSINVVIEIPAQSRPIKYEMNKKASALFVNRFLTTSMHYPCDYGFIPHTLAEDGDPLDVMVITPYPLSYGVVIPARPVGLLQMTDESGPDTKILAVPVNRLSPLYQHIQKPEDFGKEVLAGIAHFFQHYKDLEEGRWSKIGEWEGVESAKSEILASVKRYATEKSHA
ncbi:MAG: inorganic diphosphatase [Gammaproteobacteria bacterium]|nr:inorganic diphosphatase [Gammaproteobacteria bacterium]MCW5583929.1 inorganic diphosphatase [Gammaproteobacteria bacterium]